MTDCGYSGMPRGWYDMLGRGYRNDFCRNVGTAASPTWMCNIQDVGDKQAVYDPNMPFDPYTGDLTGWHCP
jgi:hypothetical protein